jgi:hypothetical protein
MTDRTPQLRIIGGLDEALRRGDVEAKTHRVVRVDPIEMLRDRLREDRTHRLQRAVAWWCAGIALFAVWYFAVQLVRGAL